MAGLSRTEKYKELRERLQNDTGNDLNSKELKPFESRLNQIDSNNFAAPEESIEDAHVASHARVMKEPVPAPAPEPLRRTQHQRVKNYAEEFAQNENYTNTFDNDYLNQYIQEVKQYNMEQGNAFSDDTQVNVLRQIEKNKNDPIRPFGTQSNSPIGMPKDPQILNQSSPAKNTAEIPFQNAMSSAKKEEAPRKQASPVETDPRARVQMVHQNAPVGTNRKTFTEDLFENDEQNQAETAQNLTKEDIMAEVQNLVNGRGNDGGVKKDSVNAQNQNSYGYDDRTARQQLLNETTQMRAQLDDYEDNLNEVSDKMRHTNQILNIVLIVLIIALAVILGIVIYWIVLSRGA